MRNDTAEVIEIMNYSQYFHTLPKEIV